MKHITKVSVKKAQVCSATNIESVLDGLQSTDPLACIGALLLEALEGNKEK